MSERYTHRKGRYVQVSFDNGKTWKSTGCVTIADAKAKVNGVGNEQTFGSYASKFYEDTGIGCAIWRDKVKGRERVYATYRNKQSILNNHIMPVWGNVKLQSISGRQIDNWLMEYKVSNSTKNKILIILREIFNEAVLDEIIKINPAKAVEMCNDAGFQRMALTKKEMEILFPKNDYDKMQIWGNLMHLCFFLIMRDTGFRPSEIVALRICDINFENQSVLSTKSYCLFEKKIVDRIKTTYNGQKYKVGFLSIETVDALKSYIPHIYKTEEGYLFARNTPAHFFNQAHSNNVFKEVSRKFLGKQYTQYSIRHSFMTELIDKYPKEVIMELMGHRQWEICYDNRSRDTIVKQLQDKIKQANQY